MKICITGIAGTWGRAFTKLLKDEHELIGIDNTELLVANFKKDFPHIKVHLEDFEKFKFAGQKFDLLIHLAAYKHMDLGELNVASCVENNVSKTATLFENASLSKVKILFISTDKAVEPGSVYGFTKALGERLAWHYGGSVARSGNIIGANGSVVHIWEESIKNNKPLNVTSLDMVRYFIEVDKAVKLAWGGFKRGDRLTLIDDGGALNLKEIINKILDKHGHTVDTYPHGINIIGLRPGERLVDKICWDSEKV